MKHLNFSTKSGSQSGSHRVVTLASTVGSPSAHRRGTMLKLISVLVLILTTGVGQMWGTCTYDLSTNSYASASTSAVVWSSQSSIATMRVDKANSSTNANNYIPTTRTSTRFYTSSTLTITPGTGVNIASIVFTATSNSYATAFANSTWTNATASASGSTVTITPTTGTSAVSATIGGTCGFTCMEVTTGSSCDKKVALTKGSEANGTFTLSKANGSYDNCDANFVVTVSNIVPASNANYCNGINVTGGNSSVSGPVDGVYTVTYTKGNNITSTITPTYAAKTQRTVTFMNNGVQYGDVRNLYDGDAVGALPSNPSSCATGKTFVGWSATDIGVTPTDVAPEFITASTVVSGSNKTYYAVFATVAPGEDEELSQTLAYDTWTYSGTTTDKTSYRLFGENSYVQSASFDLSTLSKVIVYGGTFGGASYNSLTIGDGTNTWKSITVSGTSQTAAHESTDGTALSGIGALRVTSKSGNGSGTGVRLSQVQIYTIPNVYSGYITECCTELAQINGSVDLNHLPS